MNYNINCTIILLFDYVSYYCMTGGHSRGVGFCRMETREICEKIIHSLNKKSLPASQEPLLIKFADSGNKKKRDFRNQHLMGYDNGMHG